MSVLCASSLGDALVRVFGSGASVRSRASVSGGDINRAARLTVDDGTGRTFSVFVKENAASLLPMFEAEAAGLSALRATGAIGMPEVLACGTEGNISFLLLEWIESGAPAHGFWEDFGQRLAQMHTADTGSLFDGAPRFGFPGDNFIGSTPQKNDPRDTWIAFFRECRLAPQFRLAFDAGLLDPSARSDADRLLDRLDRLLVEPDAPSLLHGDLWGGNYMVGPDGRAMLIDPAAYVGHREADLAMTELFGGFAPAFYDAYASIAPLQPGYRDRRDLYNLYHLLNHLNLFGPSYAPSVLRTLRQYS